MSTADAVLLGLLLLFALWGAMRGALRQILGLVVLGAAFPLAARFGPRIEPTVVKAVTVEGADLHLVAWAAVFAGVLIAGGAVIAALGPLLGSLAKKGRGLGALLGLVKGVVVLTVLLHAALFAWRGPDRPDWIRAVESSHAAVVARQVRQGLEKLSAVPGPLERRIEAVDDRIAGASPSSNR